MALNADPQLMPTFGFSAKTEIFKEGDIGDVAYVVQSGEVEIARTVNGRRKVLGVIRAGGIFGEMALIDGKPRMASATALTDTSVLIIRRDLMERKLEAADPFIKRLLSIFVRNIRSMADG